LKNKYSVVIFAYNISHKIQSCIQSIFENSIDADIYIIANGCSDATEQIVKDLQADHSNLHLVSLPIADKASAWNYYIYNIATTAALHFFIDGDINIEKDALSNIIDTFKLNPEANIVGGVPIVGRDKDGWIQRMKYYGRVSGGLYALQNQFIEKIKTQNVKLPIGFVGDDFLVSGLAKNMLDFRGFSSASPRLIIDSSAGFSFQQISYLRMSDYFLYLRRLIRYRIRDYQLIMLINAFLKNKATEIPESVYELYDNSGDTVNYYWRGRMTLLDCMAVFTIKKQLFKKRKTAKFKGMGAQKNSMD
jgi:glycosyltransferase involved in cell wall biosynthesis